MNRIYFIIIFALFPALLNAQIDTALYNKLQREYDEYVIQEKKNFEKFKEERDKEFMEFLKKDWENFKLFSEQKPIELPGPQKIPTYDKKGESPSSKKLSQKRVSITEGYSSQTETGYSKPIPLPETPASKKDYDLASLDFYGKIANIIYPKQLKDIKIDFVSESNIANFWESMLNTDYYRIVGQLLDFKLQNNLNDWAYFKFTENFSQQIFQIQNSAKLLTWFLLSKSGYRVKVGYSGTNIYLLIPCVNTIYDYSYFVFDNLKYYIFEKNAGVKTIYTYRHNYPEANQIMNFNIYKAPVLGNAVNTRNLNFDFDGINYNFDISYSKNLIDFYNDYPQGEIQIFFNAGISSIVKESLQKNIIPVIKNWDEEKIANFLLSFVQLAFNYETDQEQFGYEKFFFPEEIFHYRSADCEDRSVFFAYLVNDFLRLPVVALNYPAHIATAVKFSETISGAYYLIDNSRYVICDPTYINAPVGACMPEYVKSEVNIIKLRNSKSNISSNEKIWQEFLNKGFIKTNYSGDIVNASKNIWYLTGLIEDEILIDGNIFKPQDNESVLFVAQTNDNAEINHIELLRSEGLIMPVGIAYADKKIYLSGYFTQSVVCGNQEVKNDGIKELFMACWDEKFNLLWLRTSGLVHEIETSNMFFAANFDKKGNFLGYEKIDEKNLSMREPIFVDTTDRIVVFSKFQGTESKLNNSAIYTSKSSYTFAETWNSLTNDYRSQGFDKSVSGIIAFLSIIQKGNIIIEGKEIIASVIAMNEDFKIYWPDTYERLKLINSIISENNVITVNSRNVASFGDIVFEKKARIKIENIKSDNVDIFVISGINCNVFDNLYKIDRILINKKTGLINVFYDNFNESVKMYLNKNILK